MLLLFLGIDFTKFEVCNDETALATEEHKYHLRFNLTRLVSCQGRAWVGRHENTLLSAASVVIEQY